MTSRAFVSQPSTELVLQNTDPRAPKRSVADLVAKVILRGKSTKTKVAYRPNLKHFFG